MSSNNARVKNLSDDDVANNILGVRNNKSSGFNESDPICKTRIRVTIDQLKPYDHNPRESKNPKYESIRTSIENSGLNTPPNITRRNPDDNYYIVVDGGNTRLEILNDLYNKYLKLSEECDDVDEKLNLRMKAMSFYELDCIFKPWKNESSALTAHMAENEERGDTLFIEKAMAVQKLREFYEDEDRENSEVDSTKKPLTIRKLSERITSQGWTVSHSHITRFEYASRYLKDVIPTALWSGAGVKVVIAIRKYEKAYQEFWVSMGLSQERGNYIRDQFFNMLESIDDETINLDLLSDKLNITLSDELDIPVNNIATEINAILSGTTKSNVENISDVTQVVQSTNDDVVEQYKNTAPPGSDHGTEPTIIKTPKSKSGKSCESNILDLPDHIGETENLLFEKAYNLAKEFDLSVTRLIPEGVERSEWGWGVFGVVPKQESESSFEPFIDDNRAAIWWFLYRVAKLYKHWDEASLNGIFEAQFHRYIEVSDRGILGTALFLEEILFSMEPKIGILMRQIYELSGHFEKQLQSISQGEEINGE